MSRDATSGVLKEPNFQKSAKVLGMVSAPRVAANLREYFAALIERLETSDEIHNGGKDKNGFYKPTKTILLKNLNLLKDLHDKPRAHAMVKGAWEQVVEDLPAEWLVIPEALREDLLKVLSGPQTPAS